LHPLVLQRPTGRNHGQLPESHHLEGVAQPLAAPRQLDDGGDGGQHYEIAVVLASIHDSVDVGEEQDGGCARQFSLVAADDVQDRIDPSPHACLLHPGPYLAHGGNVSGRQIAAGELAGNLGECGERIEPGHQRRPEAQRLAPSLASALVADLRPRARFWLMAWIVGCAAAEVKHARARFGGEPVPDV